MYLCNFYTFQNYRFNNMILHINLYIIQYYYYYNRGLV